MPEAKRPLKIFLCHTSVDKPKVRELYRYLRRRGIQPWLDEENLIGGQDWQVEIPKALSTSDAIIVCLTKNAVDKEGYVQKEIKFALDKALEMPEGRIYLIPVRFEECEVPFSLSRYQWVDLFEQNGFPRLMKSLRTRASQLERAAVQVPKPDESSPNLASESVSNISLNVEGNIQGSTIIVGDQNVVHSASDGNKKREQELELKNLESQAIQQELKGDLQNARKTWYEIRRIDPLFPRADVKIRELERELQPPLRRQAERVEKKAVSRPKPIYRRFSTQVVIAIIIAVATILAVMISVINRTPEPTVTFTATITTTFTSTSTDTNTPTMTPTFAETFTPTPLKSFIYTVQEGDSLASVAQKFLPNNSNGILLILQFNPKIDPATQIVSVGQEIIIPNPDSKLSSPTPVPPNLPMGTEITYVIQPGDSLALIAGKFNSTIDAIVQKNKLPDANGIYVGQQILIPVNIITPTPTRPPTSTPKP